MSLWSVLGILLGFFVAPSSYAQFYLGNRGEGVALEEKVYLRDLYVYDLHKNPFVGKDIHAQIGERLRSFDRVPLTPPQWSLLARKISDVERAAPCMGKVLTDALFQFAWSLDELPFPLVDEREELRPVPSHMRVTVAARYLSMIHIYRPAWDKMPDEHKVALLIHELIYSLVSPTHRPGHGAGSPSYQNVAVVRALVAKFFTRPELSSRVDIEVLTRQLALPRSAWSCETLSSYSVSGSFAPSIVSSIALSETALEKDLRPFCQAEALGQTGPFSVAWKFQSGSFQIRHLRYRAEISENQSTLQTRLKVFDIPLSQRSGQAQLTSVSDCVEFLKKQISE